MGIQGPCAGSANREVGHTMSFFVRTFAAHVVAVIGLCFLIGGNVAAQQLNINSKAAVLMDFHSGRILYEINAHEPLPPASVTKIMTLTLALEAIRDGQASPKELVVASDYAARMGGTQIWLEAGEQMPLEEMLFAIAVGSANDSAVAVAEHLAGSEPAFVEAMNAKAKELGLRNTQFANPSGLPPTSVGKTGPHVSTAYDLAVLSRYAMNLPRFTELVSTWGPITMRPETIQRPVLWSYNKMLNTYRGMDGIKTGMTSEAGYCLAASAERDGVRLIAVTLGAATLKDREEDIRQLLDFGFSRLRAEHIAQKGVQVGHVRISKGKETEMAVVAGEDLTISIDKDAPGETKSEIVYTRPLVAPIAAGEHVGYLATYLDGEEVGRIPLVAQAGVERASVWQLIARFFLQLVGGA